MLIIIIRTLMTYAVVISAVRLMGKRQVSDMQTSELVITLIISQVASLPLENPERPFFSGLIPILLLASIEIAVSVLMMKNRKVRGLICGHPILIIRNGEMIDEELKRLRISRDDVYSLLRQQSYSDEKSVAYGVIEPNGSLSVLEKKDLSCDGISSVDLNEEISDLETRGKKGGKKG